MSKHQNKNTYWEFSDDLMIRTHHFHCWSAQIQSLMGELRFFKQHVLGKKKKKNKKTCLNTGTKLLGSYKSSEGVYSLPKMRSY